MSLPHLAHAFVSHACFFLFFSPKVAWTTGDGDKCAGAGADDPNKAITSAVVADGVLDMSTEKWYDDDEGEIGVFQFCTELETVMLPESLRKIGESAFMHCTALVHVDIPSGVNEIGDDAFEGCLSLENVTIPEGVVELPHGIFHDCESLESVKLPSSLKKIGEMAFNGCFYLTTINDDALEGVTEIGACAFYSCSSLTTFKIPPLLKTIEHATFKDCHSLSEVELPPSLETIGWQAFNGLDHHNLSIKIPNGVLNVLMPIPNDQKEGWSTMGRSISLPTSLSMLTNGGDIRGLLYGVQEVVISSRVDLSLLVLHMKQLPELNSKAKPFLRPDLEFKVLYGGPPNTPPPQQVIEHVPESIFSFDVTPSDLFSLHGSGGSNIMVEKVDRAFRETFVARFVEVSQSSKVEIPIDIFYHVLHYLWGTDVSACILRETVGAIRQFSVAN